MRRLKISFPTVESRMTTCQLTNISVMCNWAFNRIIFLQIIITEKNAPIKTYYIAIVPAQHAPKFLQNLKSLLSQKRSFIFSRDDKWRFRRMKFQENEGLTAKIFEIITFRGRHMFSPSCLRSHDFKPVQEASEQKWAT